MTVPDQKGGKMSITYEQIKKANEQIATTDIKGKNYAEVNQRIKAFRMLYPQGFIRTDLVSNENGVCVFRARVGYYENGAEVDLGIGHAYEKEGSTFINKTSYIENCETSAVGRALGMAGLGIDVSIASAEEVQNAIANQNNNSDDKAVKEYKEAEANPDEKISKEKLKQFKDKCKADGLDEVKVAQVMGVDKLSDLTNTQAYVLAGQWSKIKGKIQ